MSADTGKKSISVNIGSLLVTVIGGIIVALFIWWLNSEKFDLRYTLSGPIRLGGAQEEIVQQIEVKNLSKSPVEKIQVKFPPKLTSFEVTKNSQADNVDHFKDQDSEEFIYPVLPPQGSFSIVFKTADLGITRSDVRVFHSKGEATYALGTDDGARDVIVFVAFPIAAIIYFVIIFLYLRSIGIDSWNFKAEYSSKLVLKRLPPIYIPYETWAKIRNKAIENLPMNSYGKDVEDLNCYKWLNDEMPGYISGEEWELIKTASIKSLDAAINEHMDAGGIFWERGKILKYLRVKKPMQYPQGKWSELQAALKEKFLKRRVDERFGNDVTAMLQEPKPDEIEQVEWATNQATLAVYWVRHLYDNALLEESPLDYIAKKNISIIPAESKDRLLKDLYRIELKKLPNLFVESYAEEFLGGVKPAWMYEADYLTCKRAAEDTLVNVLLKYILNKMPLPKKWLECLEPKLQEKIREVDEQIRKAKEENIAESIKMSKEIRQLANDREKVLKQLNILNNLLADPASIDRVESYENPFEIGNFELLKKISQLLLAKK